MPSTANAEKRRRSISSSDPVIPSYDVIGRLGSGAFGCVYKVRDRGPVPVTRAAKILDGGPFGLVEDATTRFHRECEALASLDHRALARYVTSGYTDDEEMLPFIVMDFVEGEPLHRLAPTLPIDARVRAIAEVLDGLSHAHQRGVLHRDVKPSNIVVRTSDLQPVLVDFGTAYLFDAASSSTLTSSALGTPGFIPPEVLANPRHRSVTHDIFSTSAMIHQLVVGSLPVVATPLTLDETLPQWAGLSRILARGLAPESSRYQSTSDFQDELLQWLDLVRRRTEMTPSPRGQQFARRLAEAKAAGDERAAKRAREDAAMDEAWSRWKPEVLAGVEAALEEAALLLNEHHPGYVVSRNVEELVITSRDGLPLGVSLVGLIRRDTTWKFVIMELPQFKNVMQGELGLPGNAIGMPEKKNQYGDVIRNDRYCVPRCWMLISDRGGARSPSVIRHAALSVEIPGRNLEEQVANSVPIAQQHRPSRREPCTPKSAEAVRDFIFEILDHSVFRFM